MAEEEGTKSWQWRSWALVYVVLVGGFAVYLYLWRMFVVADSSVGGPLTIMSAFLTVLPTSLLLLLTPDWTTWSSPDMVEFRGIEAPRNTFPVVEFQTSDGFFDLHNNATFLTLSVSPDPPTLRLQFSYAEDWRRIDESDIRVVLVFGGVSELVVRQSADYDARAATTLEGVSFDQAESSVHVDLGDFDCTFRADTMALELAHEHP